MLRVLILIVVLAGQAKAGAWPRAEGQVFLTLSGHAVMLGSEAIANRFSTVYGEYGVDGRVTLGIEQVKR